MMMMMMTMQNQMKNNKMYSKKINIHHIRHIGHIGHIVSIFTCCFLQLVGGSRLTTTSSSVSKYYSSLSSSLPPLYSSPSPSPCPSPSSASASLSPASAPSYHLIKSNSIMNEKQFKIYLDTTFPPEPKLITMAPCGLNGFYTLGIAIYIKSQLNVENHFFSGSSAGGWNALFMCYDGERYSLTSKIWKILEELRPHFQKGSILSIEQRLKNLILKYFNNDDFNFRRLMIGVTCWDNGIGRSTVIYSDFESLEDALDCCIASSHIPLLTGGLYHKYRGSYVYDGGFSSYPYMGIIHAALHITPYMFDENKPTTFLSLNINDLTTLLSRHRYNALQLFLEGFFDGHIHLSNKTSSSSSSSWYPLPLKM